jgi:serine protease Do
LTTNGLSALQVQAGSPADQAGLKPGDVVTRANGIAVRRALDFERAMIGTRPGQSVPLTISRNGQSVDMTLPLIAANQRQESAVPQTVDEIAWRKLGLRLVELSPEELSRYRRLMKAQPGSDYKFDGGLRVVSTRSSSPAAQNGIRPGDVLVGLHKWKTMSFDNIAYILREPEITQQTAVTFYIVRGGDTFFGQLPVTWITK